MNGVHDPELAAHVVAWHNRHPLAVRITADHVRGLGTIRLPLQGLPATPPLAAFLEITPSASTTSARGLRARATEGADLSPQVDAPSHANSPPAQPRRTNRHTATKTRAQPAFSEPFIERLGFSAIAKFAGRYGAEHDPFEGAAPLRDVPASLEAIAKSTPLQVRYLRTVAIETDEQRVRILLAASRWRRPAILGRRVYSRNRIAWCGCVLSLVACAFAAGVLLPASESESHRMASAALASEHSPNVQTRSVQAADPTPTAAEGSSAPRDSARASVAALVPAPDMPLPDPAFEPSIAADPKPVPAHPATEPEGGKATASSDSSNSHGWPVSIRPTLTPEAARDARRLAAALRQVVTVSLEEPITQAAPAQPPGASSHDGPPSTVLPSRQAQVPLKVEPSRPVPVALTNAQETAPGRIEPVTPPHPARPVRSPQADEQSYALVARQTRSRAASELLLGLMRDSEIPAGWPATRTEVIPTPQGFRAGWFPFASREEAEAARERLSRSGLPTEVIEF